MIFDLGNEYDLPKFNSAVRVLIEQGAEVELRRRQRNRTPRQNRYLHLILGWFAYETGYTTEEVKQDIFKRQVNREIFAEEFDGRRGRITRMRSTSALTAEELTLAISRFRNYAAQNGIYLPSSDERQMLFFCEQQIEKNKEYQ